MRISKLTNRKERIFLLYNYLLLNWSFNDLTLFLKNNKIFSSEEEDGLIKIVENLSKLEAQIIPHIAPGWSWERFNSLEKAILLNGTAEITMFFNKKNIVINESVEFAKKYCQEDASSLINAILDKF